MAGVEDLAQVVEVEVCARAVERHDEAAHEARQRKRRGHRRNWCSRARLDPIVQPRIGAVEPQKLQWRTGFGRGGPLPRAAASRARTSGRRVELGLPVARVERRPRGVHRRKNAPVSAFFASSTREENGRRS